MVQFGRSIRYGLPAFATIVNMLLAGCQRNDEPIPTPANSDVTPRVFTVGLSNDVIEALGKGDTETQAAIRRIQSAPDRYAPPVFYALSSVLFQEGKKEDAAFWFYAGQLRARFDANRCADVTARQAVGILNLTYGTPINEYMFQRVKQLEALIPKVIEWDRQTPRNYDHRWINLHGMNAVLDRIGESTADSTATSLPEDQWGKIAEETRAEYLAGFRQATSPTGRGHPGGFFTDPDVVALVLAVERGKLEEIDQIVSRGIDVNTRGKEDLTPLVWAMMAKNKKAFKCLLEHGADPNVQTTKGLSPISLEAGSSPISLAARVEDDTQWLEMVLQHGANPNLVNPTDEILSGKRTPIFNAIGSRNIANLKLLIDAGADLNHQDGNGNTPMMYAAGHNWFDTVYRLLDEGADFRIKDKYGYDLAYETIDSSVDPEHELGRWREKVIEFLENEGVDLEPIRKVVAKQKKELLERIRAERRER